MVAMGITRRGPTLEPEQDHDKREHGFDLGILLREVLGDGVSSAPYIRVCGHALGAALLGAA